MTEIARGGGRPIKKFYKQVSVEKRPEGFVLLLDGKPAKTPAGKPIALPTQALAEAVAEEWKGEGDTVDFDGLRLTRLATTALDLSASKSAQWTEEIVSFARSDLLCYRAETPAALVRRQSAEWEPLIDWARQSLGADFTLASGVVAVAQSPRALAAIERAAAALPDWRKAGAWHATTLSGSAVIGLALAQGAFSAERLFASSRLDERFQREKWGVDAEAAAREARIEADFMAAARWLELLA